MIVEQNIDWFNISDWRISGKGWNKTERNFDRLPHYAKSVVTDDIWMLSRRSTGLYIQFETDSPSIFARWRLGLDKLSEIHMPATSVSGLDLYGKDEFNLWRWVGIGKPTGFPESSASLIHGLRPQLRRYLLYLPLYNELESLELGILRGSRFEQKYLETKKSIVFYGSSITQGIACSRSGMCYPSICHRRINHPVINLGFSGRAKMEFEVAKLLAEIDASCYVIDCLPNMEADLLKERSKIFIEFLCKERPGIPIILMEDRTYSFGWILSSLNERNIRSRNVLKKIFIALKNKGFNQLVYVKGTNLLGQDSEATVDGTHPSDLGFWRIAEQILPFIRMVLE